MPDLSDYTAINLNGMEIEDFDWEGEVLEVSFGAGYGATAVLNTPGLHQWRIFSGCLPGDAAYENLINSKPRWDYYFDFFVDHTTGPTRIFEINFRGKRYHASFVDKKISAQMFTYDLFGECTLAIQQRRVAGIQYFADGSIFDPASQLEVWGWYDATDSWDNTGGIWADKSGNSHDLSRSGTHSSLEANVQNGLSVVRLNSGTADTYLRSFELVTIYDAFFVLKVREATFSSAAGLITADAGVPYIIGLNGGAVWVNNSLGSQYTYYYNNVSKAESNQTAPMNVFAVIHARYATGIALNNMQIGKNGGTAGTFIKADLGEIILCDSLLDLDVAEDIRKKLASPLRWGIS